MNDSIVLIKSMDFAIRIVRLFKHLRDTQKEFIMSKQLLKSGTSVGANLHEAKYAQSRNDFISKNSIALKEIAETQYWLELLYKTDYLNLHEYSNINTDCDEIVKMLTSIVKSSKSKK